MLFSRALVWIYHMLYRFLIAGVLSLMCASSVPAEPMLHFRGKHLTLRHFVYGIVNSSFQRAVTINLGYAHGIQLGQEVGLLRRHNGQVVPIGVLRVSEVRPGDSFGEYEGDFQIQRDDIVIVSARQLDLWNGQSRSDQLVIKSLLSRNNRGYDTGAVSPSLLQEVGEDNDFISDKPPLLHVNAEADAMRHTRVRDTVVRGAFHLALRVEGAGKLLSEEDKRMSRDKPMLDMEMALARFAETNKDGKIAVDNETLRILSEQMPAFTDPDDVRAHVERANTRIRTLIHPR